MHADRIGADAVHQIRRLLQMNDRQMYAAVKLHLAMDSLMWYAQHRVPAPAGPDEDAEEAEAS